MIPISTENAIKVRIFLRESVQGDHQVNIIKNFSQEERKYILDAITLIPTTYNSNLLDKKCVVELKQRIHDEKLDENLPELPPDSALLANMRSHVNTQPAPSGCFQSFILGILNLFFGRISSAKVLREINQLPKHDQPDYTLEKWQLEELFPQLQPELD